MSAKAAIFLSHLCLLMLMASSFALRTITSHITLFTTRCTQIAKIQSVNSQLGRHVCRSYSLQSHRPDEIEIPLDKVEFSFARSSGPGGQNVNKLNTKAELRFNVDTADWLPADVKSRLKAYQSSKINKENELVLTSQEHRTQSRNREDCIDKLRKMVAEALIEPKERSMWEGISEKGKEVRRQDKRQRGEVKDARRSSKNFRDFDD